MPKLDRSGRDHLHTKVYTKTNGKRGELFRGIGWVIALEHEDSCKGLVKNDTCTCQK